MSANRGSARAIQIGAGVAAIAAIAVLVWTRTTGGEGLPKPAAPAPTVFQQRTVSALDDPKPKVTADQLGGLHFTDVTSAAGLSVAQSPTPTEDVTGMTSGAAVADVDGDGWDDLYVTRIGTSNSLYRNNADGTFTDVTADAGVPGPEGGSTTAISSDFDGDGNVDLLVAAADRGQLTYYRGIGSGRFSEDSSTRGLELPALVDAQVGSQLHGFAVSDIDHDGDLDLLVAQWDTGLLHPPVPGPPTTTIAPTKGTSGSCRFRDQTRQDTPRPPGVNPSLGKMLLNDGTGHFRDATNEYALRLDLTMGFTPQFADVDGDGWDDLLLTGDSCTSRLYRNVDGTRFEDVTDRAKVGTDENGMGSVVRDVDGDGDLDWFITSISYPTADGSCPGTILSGCSGNRLYLNDGHGTFTDATDRFGVRNGWWGWGAAIEDFGNDGRLEFTMTNGYQAGEAALAAGSPATATYMARFPNDPMRFWVPLGDHYEDAAAMVGMTSTERGHALIPFDYDHDGRLDVFVANATDPPRLYRNESTPGRGWLTIRLDDPEHPGNRQALGAKVRVSPGSGVKPVVGWIQSSGSYESAKPAELHIGLGDRHEPVEKVEVWWPGSSTAQVFEGVGADERVTLSRRP